jgi:hypothetical protein
MFFETTNKQTWSRMGRGETTHLWIFGCKKVERKRDTMVVVCGTPPWQTPCIGIGDIFQRLPALTGIFFAHNYVVILCKNLICIVLLVSNV